MSGNRLSRFVSSRKPIAGVVASAVCLAAASLSHAALVQDSTYFGSPVVYSNGAGSGFGGLLGGGSLSVDLVGSNVEFRFTPSGGWSNNVALWIDANPSAGLTDAQMNDVGDPGRGALSSPIRASNLNFPGAGATADNTILPEYGISFFDNGAVSFFLGNNTAHTFDVFQGTEVPLGNTRRISIPLASLGNPTSFNFFAGLISNDGYASNESLPGSSLQSTGNPGFGDQQFGGAATPEGGFGINNYNRFAVPEPAALSLLTIPGLFIARRRRTA